MAVKRTEATDPREWVRQHPVEAVQLTYAALPELCGALVTALATARFSEEHLRARAAESPLGFLERHDAVLQTIATLERLLGVTPGEVPS